MVKDNVRKGDAFKLRWGGSVAGCPGVLRGDLE